MEYTYFPNTFFAILPQSLTLMIMYSRYKHSAAKLITLHLPNCLRVRIF